MSVKSLNYSIALQRAIEAHCRGSYVKGATAEECPHHAEKLNRRLDGIRRLQKTLREICDELYGHGFEVMGWHLNGDSEPIESWFDDNGWCDVITLAEVGDHLDGEENH